MDYELAGLGSRALAAAIDSIILVVLLLAVFFVAAALNNAAAFMAGMFMILVPFLLLWGYFTLFEGLQHGQTPGKRLTGLRVIRDTGHPITMREAVARNILRIADFLPPPYLLGIVLIAVHPKAKRLGDLVAGTVVVRDRPLDPLSAGFGEEGTTADADLGPPQLSDQEFQLLREFATRVSQLDAPVRNRLATRLVEAFGDRVPSRHGSAVTNLTDLHRDEVARRKGRYGARVVTTRRDGASANSVAERLVARKGSRWREFGRMAERASESGLQALEPTELPDFAARYREVAADLARARTYGADPRTTLHLERLVAAGHNLLYRDERHTGRRMIEYLVDECPAAVVAAWRPVAICTAIFAAAAFGGYRLLRERPALAEEVLPAVMLERAAQGSAAQRTGHTYGETDTRSRPLLAASIITNNITVAFTCFATGAFLGVGSLVSIAFNGLELGAASGHFHNVGLLAYLWTFVAGHGVLELFAIFIAGAAGFLLGLALIAPGDYSRRDALIVQGRRAVPMITCTLLLLVIAGTVEGLVSASPAPVQARLVITVISVVGLVLYLRRGWRYLDSRAQPVPADKTPPAPAH